MHLTQNCLESIWRYGTLMRIYSTVQKLRTKWLSQHKAARVYDNRQNCTSNLRRCITIHLASFELNPPYGSKYSICMQRLSTENNSTRGFPHNPNSAKISFCFKFFPSNSNKECSKTFCTYHDSYAIVGVQNHSLWNEIRTKRILTEFELRWKAVSEIETQSSLRQASSH